MKKIVLLIAICSSLDLMAQEEILIDYNEPEMEEEEQIYTLVEKMPVFEGCETQSLES